MQVVVPPAIVAVGIGFMVIFWVIESAVHLALALFGLLIKSLTRYSPGVLNVISMKFPLVKLPVHPVPGDIDQVLLKVLRQLLPTK
jgi:hypothetical protein